MDEKIKKIEEEIEKLWAVVRAMREVQKSLETQLSKQKTRQHENFEV